MPGLQGTWRLSESSCLNQALVLYTIMNVVMFLSCVYHVAYLLLDFILNVIFLQFLINMCKK